MAHFAQLDNNDIVMQVIVVDNKDCLDRNGREREWVGQRYLRSIFGDNTRWVQTSYNGSRRKKFAAVGDKFDQAKDCFIPPKMYDSWIFDEAKNEWVAPIPYPEDGEFVWSDEQGKWIKDEDQGIPKQYNWNEEAQRWDEI